MILLWTGVVVNLFIFWKPKVLIPSAERGLVQVELFSLKSERIEEWEFTEPMCAQQPNQGIFFCNLKIFKVLQAQNLKSVEHKIMFVY